ncbi:glycosyltransferase family 2 protein [Paracoccus sp. J56]|uniref:glycosyltransferase family 2 protein n=1 Tax=Paracoccus sp. J56 TaxID=935850 RepID=UPI000A0C8B19|nr:glycosyltransferase family 2 protein [Paracoccus sp. J56]SMG12708.1 Glycosyltransferase involved in cell wall bisynthesis [Paracoccus sp. J56]
MTVEPLQDRAPLPSRANDWALCVSTYNRGSILCDCVRAALASDERPAEIIIVDASADWAQNRDNVAAVIAEMGGCPLSYEPAQRKSLTVQRNQAVALARADILFMIDDDALLHPACASRIMAHYRADTRGRIAAISACNTSWAHQAAKAGELKQTGRVNRMLSSQSGLARHVIDFALRHLLMIPADQRFLPYDPPERRWQGDTSLPQGLVRLDFIVGFALTLRRAVALREPFDEGLVGSAIAEDLDASYRLGRHGILAMAPDAPIHHLEAAAGRDRRRVNAALALLNIAYFVRRNSAQPGRDLARYALWYLRMTLAELPKDLAGGRWNLPQTRGALLAGRNLPALWRQPRERLQAWYQDLQTRLMTGTLPGHGQNNATAPDPGVNG